MIVTGLYRVTEFAAKYRDANLSLASWVEVVSKHNWRNPAEARSVYGSLDPAVPVASGRRVAVFNIKGNKYRLIASIDYPLGIVNVLRVMTHKEYTKGKWKESL